MRERCGGGVPAVACGRSTRLVWRRRPRRRVRAKHADGVAAASPPSHAGEARKVFRESGTLPPHQTLPPHRAKAGRFQHTRR